MTLDHPNPLRRNKSPQCRPRIDEPYRSSRPAETLVILGPEVLLEGVQHSEGAGKTRNSDQETQESSDGRSQPQLVVVVGLGHLLQEVVPRKDAEDEAAAGLVCLVRTCNAFRKD